MYCLGSIFPIDFSSSILSLRLLTSLNFGFDVHFFFLSEIHFLLLTGQTDWSVNSVKILKEKLLSFNTFL